MNAATQNEMERLVRVNREQQTLLDQIYQYVDEQGLAKLGQSRVKALIEAHKRAEVEQHPADSADVRLDKQCRQDVAAALGFHCGGNYAWSYLLQQIKDAVSAAEQKPEPDVAQLVEVLTELCDEIDKHEIHAAISKTSISWFKRKARKALAAHRKQGGEAWRVL